MTRISFFSVDGMFTGFKAEGHTGYAPEGKDIVCAGVSALLQSTVQGLTDLLEIEVAVETKKKTGLFICRLPQALPGEKQQKADLLLRSMYLGLEQMAAEYGDYLQVFVEEVATNAF